MKNIVLNIPHSSINGLSADEFGKWSSPLFFANDVVRVWTDWYTDLLFKSDNPKVKSVVFPYSRFVCDAERLENDDMENIGQGIGYTSFAPYRRTLTGQQKARIHGLWHGHQKALRELIDEDTVIIDCHSFPSEKGDVDICIGHNDDWSYDPQIVSLIRNAFEKRGYSVAVNFPYSNSITPKAGCRYKSVMIEVNKRVYMEETGVILKADECNWKRWSDAINEIYEKIINLD